MAHADMSQPSPPPRDVLGRWGLLGEQPTVGVDRESETPDPPLTCDFSGDAQYECEEHDQ